nr:uroporphyrinogen-III synthase [uncultured Marinifilum sp.]
MTSVKPKKILFTRSLSESHYEFGKDLGLSLSDYPFITIKINELKSCEIENINSKPNSAWIFTSRNAVKSLLPILSQISINEDKKIYAVGLKTAAQLEKSGLHAIVPSSHNARALVKLMAQNKEESYTYFCGNIRKNTIVNFFQDQEIDYQEIECYQTKLVQPDINIDLFDAICFCSPSAVNSFFKKYKLSNPVPCIAIGHSSAVKLLDYTEHVVMSDTANIKSMLEICKEYLNY